MNAECRDALLGFALFRIQHSAFRILCIYWYFQSVIGQHHAFGEGAVDVGGEAHAVAAMREPGLPRPYPFRDFYRLVQGEMRIVFLLLQRHNNQVFNALQFFNRLVGNLAQVGDVGEVADAEGITGQREVFQFYRDNVQVAEVEGRFVEAADVVGRGTRIRMFVEGVGILALDFGQGRVGHIKRHGFFLLEDIRSQVVEAADMVLVLM